MDIAKAKAVVLPTGIATVIVTIPIALNRWLENWYEVGIRFVAVWVAGIFLSYLTASAMQALAGRLLIKINPVEQLLGRIMSSDDRDPGFVIRNQQVVGIMDETGNYSSL